MPRLIDADALVEKAYWHGEHPSVDDLFAEGVDAVDVSDIEEAPTIEAEPLRHGRWVHTNYAIHWTAKDECSECTYHALDRNDLSHYNYCPHCGAKMDLEESDG